jgi:ssRNA-specific RNase YbeY (16S rRNA maturation enzyme)
MLFNYKITIELDSTFDAPLLGADTTGYRRVMIDKILTKEIKEMVAKNIETKEISDENMKVTITLKKQLRGLGKHIKDKNKPTDNQ